MTRSVRRDARIFYEGKRGGHSVTTTSEALDRLDRPGGALRSSLALRCLRPPGRVDLLTAPSGRRSHSRRLASLAVSPVSPFESTWDSTATAPQTSPADSFGGRDSPASLVPRTVPAGGRLGGPRHPPASARHVSTGYTLEPVQPIAWRTESARRAWRRSRHVRGGRRSRPPARAEGASLCRPYPSREAEGAPRPRPRTPGTASEPSRDREARISGIATASAPRAFEAVASPAWLPRSAERVTGSNIEETEDAVSTDVHT